MKILKTLIPFAAGSITITNFILGIVYSIAPQRSLIVDNIIEFPVPLRILLAILLCVVASMLAAEMIVKSDKSIQLPSRKFTYVSMISLVLAWIVVFNIKVLLLSQYSENIEALTTVLIISIPSISIFNSLKINYTFKELNYPNGGYEVEHAIPYPSPAFFTPKYIRAIRPISYYLVAILCAVLF